MEYVLDGQQRIITLFVALRGERVGKIDYSEIYVNLEASQDEEIIITDVSDKDKSTYIRFKDLLNSSLSEIYSQFKEEASKTDLISEYKTNVSTYDFSVIEVATDIFTRINVGGKPLTVFEIMCAKIYDKASMFALSDKFNDFIESIASIKFDTIPEVMPLQLIALILRKNCKGSTILNLKKEEVIGNWDNAILALKCAIDFVRASFGVQSSKLLPYDVLLIPIAYYIYKTKCKCPTGDHAAYLTDMFWRYAIMQRYNNATESKLASDITIIDTIISGEDYRPAISADLSEKYFRENGSFRIGKCITKAIVCLLLLQNPMRLDNANHKVLTDEKELVKGNGKNYHHFFPRAYMRKKGFEDDIVDNIIK